MITSSLISDLRQLSKDVTISLRDVPERTFASDLMSAFGTCICSVCEVSSENSAVINSRLLHAALRALKRADVLIEIGTDGGTIPEAQGNRWLSRCRTLLPRLENAYKDSRRLAGLSFRLPKTKTLFTTARLTVRSIGEGDLTFIVTLLSLPDCSIYGVTPPHSCDAARELVRNGTVSLITRGDGERVGVIFCSSDANVAGRSWLSFAIAPDHRGRGYSLEAVSGFTDYVFENGLALAVDLSIPRPMGHLADALCRYGYTLDSVGEPIIAQIQNHKGFYCLQA